MKIFTDKSSAVVHDSVYPADGTLSYMPGQVLVLSGGLAVPAQAGETGAVLGVCLSALEYGADGEAQVRAADSPTTVYACPAPEITATSGTTATVTAADIASFSNDDFNGGLLKLEGLGASSTNSGNVGDVYEVSDFDAGNKKFTIDDTLSGAVAEGDKFLVFPPVGTSFGVLDSNRKNIALTAATSGFAMRVVGWDVKNGNILVMANKHVYGTKAN